jgi:hypothetical protein
MDHPEPAFPTRNKHPPAAGQRARADPRPDRERANELLEAEGALPIAHMTPHTLRRTCASILAVCDVPPGGSMRAAPRGRVGPNFGTCEDSTGGLSEMGGAGARGRAAARRRDRVASWRLPRGRAAWSEAALRRRVGPEPRPCDTRTMIPLLLGSTEPRTGAGGHNRAVSANARAACPRATQANAQQPSRSLETLNPRHRSRSASGPTASPWRSREWLQP